MLCVCSECAATCAAQKDQSADEKQSRGRKRYRGDVKYSELGLVTEKAAIAVYTAAGILVVDRTTVGQKIPNPEFAERFEAPLRELGGSIDLRIIKDTASAEVFADEGRSVISANLFYDEPFEEVSIFGVNDVEISGEISVLRSIWRDE